jgi:hypothetical protein
MLLVQVPPYMTQATLKMYQVLEKSCTIIKSIPLHLKTCLSPPYELHKSFSFPWELDKPCMDHNYDHALDFPTAVIAAQALLNTLRAAQAFRIYN